ncbi:hypothetical protein PHYBOEH_001444 [Phytophthora boehmeriae]|uniref:Carbohydrate-binding domain-containing protein n=1 Tax=Phytophthora boehmeriae TaxID=109152 RepID=A0A8T1WW75_9STRA|nr:hypothetical protein PHYBOEH_001444 [Phytophthora boehmeriae]
MMYDDETLYVAAEIMEKQIWGTITEKNSTLYHENDFEVFFNPDGSRHRYYELEVNCLNTIWELLLNRPYKDGYSIENPYNLASLRSAVFVDGVTNSPETECVRWCVEISWSLAELQQFDNKRFRAEEETPKSSRSQSDTPSMATPRPPSTAGQTPRAAVTGTKTVAGDVWRVNFSRVQYELESVVNPDTQQLYYDKAPDKREDNIVWAPTGVIDIHRPERWGYVFFSSQDELPGGEMELASTMTGFLEEQMAIERVLDAVYYQQREFFTAHGGFASTMQLLYSNPAELSATKTAFPLPDLLQRYELSFPEISVKSDIVAPPNATPRDQQEDGSRPTSESGRRNSRRYAPALDTESEEYDYDRSPKSRVQTSSVTKPLTPPPSPRTLAVQKLEARGMFSNYVVSVHSKTQEWHMTNDGKLWRTA